MVEITVLAAAPPNLNYVNINLFFETKPSHTNAMTFSSYMECLQLCSTLWLLLHIWYMSHIIHEIIWVCRIVARFLSAEVQTSISLL